MPHQESEPTKRQHIKDLGIYSDERGSSDQASINGVFTYGHFEENIKKAPIRATLHRHNFHEIAVFHKGAGDYLADFKNYTITSPAAVLIPSGTVHHWTNRASLEGDIMAFDLEFIAARGRAIGPASILRPPVPVIIPLTENQLTEIRLLLKKIKYEYLSDCPNRKYLIRALLTIILIEIRRIHDQLTQSNQTSADKIYAAFLDTLEDHWQTHHSPKSIAQLLEITPDYLSSTLRSVTGKNASELIQERILLEAKRQLAHSRLSVSEIAYLVGFEDPSYFTRLFKKTTSMTPSEFRKEVNE